MTPWRRGRSRERLRGTWSWLTTRRTGRAQNGVWHRLLEHSGVSAAALGDRPRARRLPLALWLGHVGRGGGARDQHHQRRARGARLRDPRRAGAMPARSGAARCRSIIALVLFAIPPILTNTYVGVREVDPAAVDAARGMGMSGPQVLREVELPLSRPAAHGRASARRRAGRRHRDDRGARRRRRARRAHHRRVRAAEPAAGGQRVHCAWSCSRLSVEGLMACCSAEPTRCRGTGPLTGSDAPGSCPNCDPDRDAREGRRRLGRYSG